MTPALDWKPIDKSRSIKSGLVWIAMAMAALFASAQASKIAAPDLGRYRIAGIVVNAVTGEPVGRSAVSVLDEATSHTVETVFADGNGHFTLDRLPEAKYELTASKRGFRTGFYDEHDDYSTAIVTGPNEDTEHLTFRLQPNAVLRGVISGDGGDPVEGARVMLFKLPHGIGRDFTRARGPENSIQQVDTATTDDRGAYEFGNLATGEYVLAVMAEPWYAVQSTPRPRSQNSNPDASNAALDVAYPVTYFDSTTEEPGATPITLAPGAREEADINLHAVPALHLVVTAPQKQNGNIARPELRQLIFGTQVADESAGFLDAIQNGTTEFTGVAPGHYELLQGDPPRMVDLDATASEQIDATAGTPTVTVSGMLRSAEGETMPDGVTLFIYPMGGAPHMSPLVTNAMRGRFRFENVPPGTWEMSGWNGENPLPILSLSAYGTSHAGGIFTVSDRSLDLTATVAVRRTRIEGFTRKGGKSASGMLVVLVPKNPAAFDTLVRRDQSDSDGSFALRDVAPGEYTIIALEDAWDLDRSGPAVLARYLPRGLDVTVRSTTGGILHLTQPVEVQAR